LGVYAPGNATIGAPRVRGMSAAAEKAFPLFQADVGNDEGAGEWFEVTQEQVNQFADVTHDHQFIHVDPERAAGTPFGGTIAHGFLTLSMLAPISQQLLNVTGAKASINYGTDKVRFPAPLPVGAQFRGTGVLTEVSEVKGGVQAKATFSIEVKDAPKPALVAECLFRFFT
jgi:acyl dehydratase